MNNVRQYHWTFQINAIGPAIHVFVLYGGQIVDTRGFTSADSAFKFVREVIDDAIERATEEIDEQQETPEFDL